MMLERLTVRPISVLRKVGRPLLPDRCSLFWNAVAAQTSYETFFRSRSDFACRHVRLRSHETQS
jgi:hypothetical protein